MAAASAGKAGKLEMLQEGIRQRQDELNRVADILARSAQSYRRRANGSRGLLIFLGACAATQGGWEKVFGGHPTLFFVTFTMLGIMVTTLAGIEAAFKFETKGAELNLLAAGCHSTLRRTDAAWLKQVGIAGTEAEKLAGAMALIELQDAKLGEIQEKAASCGVNIIREVRGLSATVDLDFTDPEESLEPPPYASPAETAQGIAGERAYSA